MTKRRLIKQLLAGLLTLLLLSCQTLPKAYNSSFFPPNARFYLALNPKKIKADALPFALEQEQLKLLHSIFQRSHRVYLFDQDLGITAYFMGRYPKGLIEGNLRSNNNFVQQDRIFRETTSGIELFLPSNHELYLSQNRLASILDQKNPPLTALFSESIATSLLYDDFSLVVRSPSNTLATLVPSLSNYLLVLSPVKTLRLSANLKGRSYHHTLQFECSSNLTARAIAAMLRTARPFINERLPQAEELEIEIEGNNVIVTAELPQLLLSVLTNNN